MLFFIAIYKASPAAVPTPHVGHLFVQKIPPNNISTHFSKAIEKFKPIYGQPMDSNLAEICEGLPQILPVTPHEK